MINVSMLCLVRLGTGGPGGAGGPGAAGPGGPSPGLPRGSGGPGPRGASGAGGCEAARAGRPVARAPRRPAARGDANTDRPDDLQLLRGEGRAEAVCQGHGRRHDLCPRQRGHVRGQHDHRLHRRDGHLEPAAPQGHGRRQRCVQQVVHGRLSLRRLRHGRRARTARSLNGPAACGWSSAATPFVHRWCCTQGPIFSMEPPGGAARMVSDSL